MLETNQLFFIEPLKNSSVIFIRKNGQWTGIAADVDGKICLKTASSFVELIDLLKEEL